MSHPTWVRGLKLDASTALIFGELVAPYVGAWIETTKAPTFRLSAGVAPYVGAWIETSYAVRGGTSATKSHPTWVRGLKLAKVLEAVTEA